MSGGGGVALTQPPTHPQLPERSDGRTVRPCPGWWEGSEQSPCQALLS